MEEKDTKDRTEKKGDKLKRKADDEKRREKGRKRRGWKGEGNRRKET